MPPFLVESSRFHQDEPAWLHLRFPQFQTDSMPVVHGSDVGYPIPKRNYWGMPGLARACRIHQDNSSYCGWENPRHPAALAIALIPPKSEFLLTRVFLTEAIVAHRSLSVTVELSYPPVYRFGKRTLTGTLGTGGISISLHTGYKCCNQTAEAGGGCPAHGGDPEFFFAPVCDGHGSRDKSRNDGETHIGNHHEMLHLI